MARRTLPPTDAAPVPLAEGMVASQNGSEPSGKPPAADVTQRGVNVGERPSQSRPGPVSKPTPPRLPEHEERRWRTLVEADAGKLGQALRQADKARAAWERTVRDARAAGFGELGILSAADRVRIEVPEPEG